MSENIQKKIEDLREELHQHNYNYYTLDEPTISMIWKTGKNAFRKP